MAATSSNNNNRQPTTTAINMVERRVNVHKKAEEKELQVLRMSLNSKLRRE